MLAVNKQPPTRGDKMEREEKMLKIKEMFSKNIPTIEKIRIKPEHESMLLCLFIGNKVIGVDIQKSFIDNKTIQEIEAHFSEVHLYHVIFNDKSSALNDIFVDTNDLICREMFL